MDNWQSDRSIEAFLSLLNEHGIQALADICSFPTSRIEHFKRENMEKWLPENGVEHVWRKHVTVIHILGKGQTNLLSFKNPPQQ